MDIEQIADYITVVYGGRIVDSQDKETFLDGWRRLRLRNPNDRRLPALSNIRDVQRSGSLWAVTVADYCDELPDAFIGAGLSFNHIEALSLEEIFLSNVRHAKGVAEKTEATS